MSVDRKAHWQGVYERKAPTEVSWFQAEPSLSLEFIRKCGLQPSSPIIDVGGGASSLVDRLLQEGYEDLTVLDVSAAALVAARERLGDGSGRVEWIEADVTSFRPIRKYALWHDRAVFHFLTEPADRRQYVTALGSTLMPGACLVVATFAVGGPEKCSGLPIVQYDADKLLAELGPGFELVEEREEAHVTPAGQTQDFAWFRLVRREGA